MKGNTYCAELFDHAIPYILLYTVTHSLLLLMLTGPYLVFICIVKSKKNNIKILVWNDYTFFQFSLCCYKVNIGNYYLDSGTYQKCIGL